MSSPPIVIVGLNRHPGLQAARIFSARGIPVIGMALDPKHPCSRTNACKEIVYAASEGSYLAALEALGSQLEDKAVLLPCSDTLVTMISQHREALLRSYHVLLPEHEVVERLMDKVAFYTYASEQGLPIPSTHLIHSREDATRAAAELRFPVVVKPPNRAGVWGRHTTAKVFALREPGALLQFFEERREWAETLIAQELVEGPDANLISVNFYCGVDSEMLASFVSRKVRQWPPGAGDSTLGEETRDDEALAVVSQLCRAVGYRGIGYVEFKRDASSGQLYLIEPNVGRPTGRSAIAEAGGVELLMTMYRDALGQPLPIGRHQSYGSARWIHLRKDAQAAWHYWRRGELTLSDWARSWRGKKAYAMFSWRDPRPFLGDLGKAVRIAVNPAEVRRRGLASSGTVPPRETRGE